MAVDILFPVRALLWYIAWLRSIPGFVARVYTFVKPPRPPKTSSPLRIGLLGASRIAPLAVINPAHSHPDVLVTAVAARDKTRAHAYAKKYGIPTVHANYDDLLKDPEIDVIYNPLPNGLHFEWTLKALKAGKHVLLEKPSVSNAEEAKILFGAKDLISDRVLLEAFHYRFHPSFQTFKNFVGPGEGIERVYAAQWCPRGAIQFDDIRFKYDLAGGTLMDCGAYPVHWLRHTFDAEPETCISATAEPMPPPFGPAEPLIDRQMTAKWRFPGGAIGELDVDLSSTGQSPYLPAFVSKYVPTIKCPQVTAKLKERDAPFDPKVRLAPGETHVIQRTVSLWNPIFAWLWHRIDVDDVHIIKNASGRTVKQWSTSEKHDAYTWPSKSIAGEPWWSTYRYQLEAFVNALRNSEGSGVWISHEDSVAQMSMIDSAYLKAGLPVRKTSEYRL